MWLLVGAPAIYLGIGSMFALTMHKAFTGGLSLREWLYVMALWPMAFIDHPRI